MSASKNDKEKPDLSLIPKVSNEAHAKAFMVGEKKYGRYNYTKGHKASQLVAAAKRHLDAWFEGEENDLVDGQPHLGSVMACCSMILRQMELNTLKDDRYKQVITVENIDDRSVTASRIKEAAQAIMIEQHDILKKLT